MIDYGHGEMLDIQTVAVEAIEIGEVQKEFQNILL